MTTEQLLALGFSSAAIARRVACGRLYRVHHGVYALGRRDISREGVYLAAVLAIGDGAALTGFAAAAAWGFWNGRTAPTEVIVPRKVRSRAGIRVYGVAGLPDHAVTRQHSIPITTPAHTILRLAGTIRLDHVFRRVVHEAFVQERVGLRALQEEIDRAGPRCPGVDRVRAEIAAGVTRTRSGLEDALAELLRSVDLPPFETNARVPGTPRWVEVDVWFPMQRLAVDIDGDRYHFTPFRRELDAYKRELVERPGHGFIRLPEEAAEPVREADTVALVQRELATSGRPRTCRAGDGR